MRRSFVVSVGLSCSVALGAPATSALQRLEPVPLGVSGRVGMDYLGVEPGSDRVWAPGGNTGKVFVVDVPTRRIRTVDGFPTAERNGRSIGPGAVAFGRARAYVANRGDQSICEVDPTTLQRGHCIRLPDGPDGVVFVEQTQELWVTTPRSNTITVVALKTGQLASGGSISLDGHPEGLAVDAAHHRFFTNLEDKDETLELDLQTRRVVRRWTTGCGAEGPRGLVVTADTRFLVIACTDAVETFSLEGAPTRIDRLETGAGVDNIDVGGMPLVVFAAAGRSETLTRAVLTPDGHLTSATRIHSSKGVRTVVVTRSGVAVSADPLEGRLLILEAGQSPAVGR